MRPVHEIQTIVSYSCFLSVQNCLTLYFQNISFAMSGENLTMRLRQLSFRALMRQDIAYFDEQKNNTGALCTRLSTEASAVQGVSTFSSHHLFWCDKENDMQPSF